MSWASEKPDAEDYPTLVDGNITSDLAKKDVLRTFLYWSLGTQGSYLFITDYPQLPLPLCAQQRSVIQRTAASADYFITVAACSPHSSCVWILKCGALGKLPVASVQLVFWEETLLLSAYHPLYWHTSLIRDTTILPNWQQLLPLWSVSPTYLCVFFCQICSDSSLQWWRFLSCKWTEKHESPRCHFEKEGMEHILVAMFLPQAFASIPFPLPETYNAFHLPSWCSPLGLFLLVPLTEVFWCHFCPSTAGVSLSLPPFLPASDLCLLCCWLLLCLALQPHLSSTSIHTDLSCTCCFVLFFREGKQYLLPLPLSSY